MKRNEFATALSLARKIKGITQGQACFEIGIADETTLSKFETGKVLPSFEMAMAVARSYNDKRLFKRYLIAKGAGDLIDDYLYDPDVLYTEDLRVLGVYIQKEYNDVAYEMPRVINILYDGVIAPSEQCDCESFIQEGKEFIAVFMEFVRRYEHNKKALQDCNLERAYV